MKHTLFMIAVEGDQTVVTVTCRPERPQGPFRECIYKIGLPKDKSEGLSIDEQFMLARSQFNAIKAAL